MVIDLNAQRVRRADAAERAALARKIEKLQQRQARRIVAVAQQRNALDRAVADADAEIQNLLAQLGSEEK